MDSLRSEPLELERSPLRVEGVLGGIVYFQASAPSLARLNGIAVVYEWDVDADGHATWELWEWK